MINIRLVENDNIIELYDSKIIVDYNNFHFQKDDIEEICHEYILKIIRIIDSWNETKSFLNDFENWEVIIQMDNMIKTYTSQSYSNEKYYYIKTIFEELISRCI